MPTVSPNPAADPGMPLLAAVRRFAGGLAHPALAAFLQEWPAEPVPFRSRAAHGLPVLRWLDQAVAAIVPCGREVGRVLAAASGRLAWGQTQGCSTL
jgi:hypothetical protein